MKNTFFFQKCIEMALSYGIKNVFKKVTILQIISVDYIIS